MIRSLLSSVARSRSTRTSAGTSSGYGGRSSGYGGLARGGGVGSLVRRFLR